jgi:hypothetical protein
MTAQELLQDSLTCVDGWTAQQLQALVSQRQELNGSSNQRSLPAA